MHFSMPEYRHFGLFYIISYYYAGKFFGITALASATVVFIPPNSQHFGEVTTTDRL
jgi:hypothetical protein